MYIGFDVGTSVMVACGTHMFGRDTADKSFCVKIRSGEATLEELTAYTENMGASALPGSGGQEYLESVVNSVLFGL